MGTAASAASDPHSMLAEVAGTTPIPHNDVFWQKLFTSSVPQGKAPENVSAISNQFCSELVRNNEQTSNFQSLAVAMIEMLTQATKAPGSAAQIQKACVSVFLVRTFLKHMVETLEPEVRDRT